MKKIILSILVFLFLFLSGVSQTTVTTFSYGSPDDAIAIDSAGNIYASSFPLGEVYKYTPTGDGSDFITGLTNANGIAFDSNDNLYVCDFGGNEIGRYDINGDFDTAFTIPGNPSGAIKAIDNDDIIYTRYTANTINRITPSGTKTEISSDPLLNGPVGLAYDENGNLYVGNYNNRKIYRVGTNGTLTYIATVGSSSNLGFITFGQGRLWGTVLGEHKIYTINHNAVNEVSLFAGSVAGGVDGPIDQATFNQPDGIKFNDTEDTLYITDFGSKNLRVINNVNLSVDDFIFNDFTMKLFPNPAKDSLDIKISVSETGRYTLKAFDVNGKKLFEKEVISENSIISENIDITQWTNGLYLIEFTDNRGFSMTKRLVK